MRFVIRPTVAAAAALLAFGPTSLLAQRKEGVRDQLERELDKKRDAMREGKVVRSSVRVKVRLRNESRIEGVVKNGRFIEKVDGLEFVPADLQTTGAGLRIWYYDNTNSFIFLPYKDIAHYRIGERLTDEEIRKIEERILRAEREAAQRRREMIARRKLERARNGANGAEGSDDGSDDGAEDANALTPEQAALLAEFPPEEGWGTERMREIEIRKITVGVFPDAKSRKFVRNFEEWLKAKSIRDAQKPADSGDEKAEKKNGEQAESKNSGKDAGKDTPADEQGDGKTEQKPSLEDLPRPGR